MEKRQIDSRLSPDAFFLTCFLYSGTISYSDGETLDARFVSNSYTCIHLNMSLNLVKYL